LQSRLGQADDRHPTKTDATDNAPEKRPSFGSLIPIITGLVALLSAVTYAITRYSYQQFYDRFGLTPDDVGPSSAAALTQSGIRIATFVLLFAVVPAGLALLVSQAAAAIQFKRWPAVGRLHALLWLILPIAPALLVYRLFTHFTSGSGELIEQIAVAIAVVLLTRKRYGPKMSRLEWLSIGWIVTVLLSVCGAHVLAGSLPRDARKTAACVIDHHRPVRWVHTHRTFFGIPSLAHIAVLQVRADPAHMFVASKLSPQHLPSGNGSPALIYLGDAGGRDFVFDLDRRRTLQVPDGTMVIVTRPARHCHWWDYS
jgi:hypothetical protein